MKLTLYEIDYITDLLDDKLKLASDNMNKRFVSKIISKFRNEHKDICKSVGAKGRGTEHLFDFVREAAKRSPIGLMPKKIHDEFRLSSIKAAISRYLSEQKEIPAEWLQEYNELSKQYKK